MSKHECSEMEKELSDLSSGSSRSSSSSAPLKFDKMNSTSSCPFSASNEQCNVPFTLLPSSPSSDSNEQPQQQSTMASSAAGPSTWNLKLKAFRNDLLLPGVPLWSYLVYLSAAMMAISCFVYINATQASLLYTSFRVPIEELGDAAGNLAFADELLSVFTIGLWGSLSDKIGRKYIFSVGFLIMAISTAAYPWAHSLYPDSFLSFFSSLLFLRLIFACGASATASMISAVHGDFSGTKMRGISAAFVGIASGFGAILSAFLFLKLPGILQKTNFEKSDLSGLNSLQIVHGIVGLLMFLMSVLTLASLRSNRVAHAASVADENRICNGSQNESEENEKEDDEAAAECTRQKGDVDLEQSSRFKCQIDSKTSTSPVFWRRLLLGLSAMKHPSVALSYVSGFTARADSITISLFLSVWCQKFLSSRGLCSVDDSVKFTSCKEAYILSSSLLGPSYVAGLLGAPIAGRIADKVGRVQAVGLSGLIGILSYGGLVLLDDPRVLSTYILTTIGGLSQIGMIVTSLSLLSEESSRKYPNDKGSIAGGYSFAGAIGILFTSKLGGVLADKWRESAGPFAHFFQMKIKQNLAIAALLFYCARAMDAQSSTSNSGTTTSFDPYSKPNSYESFRKCLSDYQQKHYSINLQNSEAEFSVPLETLCTSHSLMNTAITKNRSYLHGFVTGFITIKLGRVDEVDPEMFQAINEFTDLFKDDPLKYANFLEMLKGHKRSSHEYLWLTEFLSKHYFHIHKLLNAALRLKTAVLVKAIQTFQSNLENANKTISFGVNNIYDQIVANFGNDEQEFIKLFEDSKLKNKQMDLKTTMLRFLSRNGKILIRTLEKSKEDELRAATAKLAELKSNGSTDTAIMKAEATVEKLTKEQEIYIKRLPSTVSQAGPVVIEKGSVVYPICLQGINRSQVMYQVFKQQRKDVTLVNPHGAANGNDPYSGYTVVTDQDIYGYMKDESSTDDAFDAPFNEVFSSHKVTRFGDEFVNENKLTPNAGSNEQMSKARQAMREYMTQHYFGRPTLESDRKHYFIAVNRGTHIIMQRLLEANVDLCNVVIVGLDYADQTRYYAGDFAKAYRVMKSDIESAFGLHSVA